MIDLTPHWLRSCILAAAKAEGLEVRWDPNARAYAVLADDGYAGVFLQPVARHVNVYTRATLSSSGTHRCIASENRPADQLTESLRRALVVVLAGREEQRRAERRQQAQEHEELRRMQVTRGDLQAFLGSAFLAAPSEEDVRGRAIVRLARDGSVTLEIARLSAKEADDILQALSDGNDS